MELMEVYREAMAVWIIARVTSGKCEGAQVFLLPVRIGHPKAIRGILQRRNNMHSSCYAI
jgi:hypothetical protein